MKFLILAALIPLMFNQPSAADDVKMDLKNFRHRLEVAREHTVIAAANVDFAFTESTKEEGKYIIGHLDPKSFASIMNVTLLPALNDLDEAVIQAGGQHITEEDLTRLVKQARDAN